MAYHEIRLLAAKMLFNFDLELCEEGRDWTEQKVFVLWEKKPLMCRLRTVKGRGSPNEVGVMNFTSM